MADEILKLSSVSKVFSQGGEKLSIINKADLTVNIGEMVALVGPSGSGKTTLLQIIGMLDKPTSGDVYISGINTNNLDDIARTEVRKKNLGFIYQQHNLLPEFSALENIMIPLMISGKSTEVAKKWAIQGLKALGLEKRAGHRPGKLSGGEQQRVAILRGLIHKPTLLLADEPTGNLDPVNAENVFSTLYRFVREMEVSAIIATHNLELARRMDRMITISDGKIIEVE